MCVGPQLLLAVATSVVSFAADTEDYNARAKQWQQNYENSLAAGRDQQRQISLRMLEEEEAYSQKAFQSTIEGAEIAAEAEVSAGEAGLSGISLDNILLGIGRKVAQKKAADDINYRNTAAQLTAEMEAVNTRVQSNINSVTRPVAPSPLGYILKGIGGALRG